MATYAPTLWRPNVIPFAPSPMFGMTRDEQDLGTLIPGLMGQPTTVVEGDTDAGNRFASLAFLNGMTGGAIGPDNDPAAWTPDEAASQTDRALARIAQANPELAQTLAAQHGKSAEEGEDLPWYKDILKGVGEVLQATKLDVVFDYLGRASHIVPEIIHDWGNDSVWENVGDALSGRANTTTWSDVLVDKLGMERSWLTAVLGFAGDVLTDPITYLAMGTGSIGRLAVAKTGAEAGIESLLVKKTLTETLETGERVVRDLGPMMEQVAARLPAAARTDNIYNDVARFVLAQTEAGAGAGAGFLTKLRGALQGVHPDAQSGAAFALNETIAQDAMLATIRVADDLFRDITNIGFQRTSAKAAAKFGIDKTAVKDILKAQVRAGSGFDVGRAAYQQGKAAAGALGGARLRLSIPVLDIRLAGLRLPFVPARMDFSFARRFFAGLTGQTRLMKMVGTGAATMEDMRILWTPGKGGGFSALRKLSTSPAVLKEFAHGPRSMFYTASEGLSKATKHLSAHSAQLRGGGLGARYAGQVAVQGRHLAQSTTLDLQTLTLADDTSFNAVETVTRIGKAEKEAGERAVELTDALNAYAGASDAATAEAAKRLAVELGGDSQLPDIWAAHIAKSDDTLLASGLSQDFDDRALTLVDDLDPEDALVNSDGIARTSEQVTSESDIGIDQLTDGPDASPTRALWTTEKGALDVQARQEARGGLDEGAEAAAQDDFVANLERAALEGDPARRLLAVEGGVVTELDEAVYDGLEMMKLSREEAIAVAQPDLVVTGQQNILDIDLRPAAPGPSAATDIINPVAEIHAAYSPILDSIAEGTYRFGDDVTEAAADEIRAILRNMAGKKEQLADITTILLKERGYTGLRIHAADGSVQLGVFYDDALGAVPLSRVTRGAPKRPTAAGRQLRGVTEAARENVQGVDPVRGDALIQRILRDTAKLGREEAEAKARAMLATEGKGLRPNTSFFETSPLRVMESASHEVSRRVKNQYLGSAARHAENLGMTRGNFGGGAVGLGRYRTVLHEGGKAWAHAKAEEKAAMEVAARVTDEAIPALQAQTTKTVEEWLAYEAVLDNIIRNDMGRAEIAQILRKTAPDVEPKVFDGRTKAVFPDQQLTPEQMVPGPVTGDAAGFVYHLGNNENRLSYRTKGLIPGRGAGAEIPVGIIPEWMRNPRLFFADSPERAAELVSGGGNNILFRVKASVVGEATPEQSFTGSRFTSDTIKPDDLEYLGADEVWHKVVGPKLDKAGVGRKSAQLKKEAEAALKAHVRGTAERTRTYNELGKLIARQQTDRAPTMAALVPFEDSLNMVGMSKLKVPGFEEFTMPAAMAEEFELAMRGYPKLDGAHAAFRQFNSWWKSMATWVIPGFHMRNMQGAFFNNWLGGVGIRDYITTGRIRFAERGGSGSKWAKTTIAQADPELAASLRYAEPSGYVMGVPIDELTYGDLADLTAELNLTASNGRLFAEAQTTVEAEAAKYTAKRGYTARIAKPYTKAMRGAGTMTENVMRTAAFVRGLREGRNVLESRGFTMMRHGDYEDMTDWEYKWIRDLIPFYKWMRTNTPFQIHQLLESPGKLLAVQKAQRAVYDVQGLEYEKERHRMPKWMAEGFTVPYDVGKDASGLSTFDTVMLDLPMSDLFMGGREFVASFLPAVRPFLESYVYNQQTFSGKPLTGKRVEMNPLFGPIAPLLDVTGLVERGPDGKAYMSDRTQNLLGIIPVYSRFKSFIYGDETSVTKRSNAVASAVFGLQLRPVDSDAMTAAEMDFYYDQILPTVEYLKDIGYELPTTADLEATIGTTDQILTKLGITPGVPSNVAA